MKGSKMKKLSKKAIERLFNETYNRIAFGVQVPIMKLGAISKAFETTYVETSDEVLATQAMQNVINEVRIN